MTEIKSLLDLLKDYGVTSLLIVLGVVFAYKYVPKLVEAFIGLMNQLGDNNAKLTASVQEQADTNSVLPGAIHKTHSAISRGMDLVDAAARVHGQEMLAAVKPHTDAIRHILGGE